MATSDRARLKELFAVVIALPMSVRERFLDEVCSGDAALRADVEPLLAAYDGAGDFLEQPPTFGADALLALVAGRIQRLEAHQRLGPYEIVAPLGAGGMGQVYRARDVRLDRTVALKVVPAPAAADAEIQRRFEQEARAIARLNHPNICALFDVGRHEDIDFLVMEYLEGETLARHLERGPLPPEVLLRSAIGIADALDRAHRAGIIHRDLKPSNVILTETGAKLLDFGIAKLLSRDLAAADDASAPSDLTLTQRGRMIGTVAYMSPEQVRGEPIDERSDVFSFGAVLYEMATGCRPFVGATAEAVCQSIVDGMLPSTGSLPAAVAGMSEIVRRALEVDPGKRYQRASDIKTDLRQLERSADSSFRARQGTPTLRLGVAFLGVVLGLAVSGYVLIRGRTPSPASPSVRRSLAVLPFKPLVAGAQDDSYIGLGLAEALTTELGAFKTIAVRPLTSAGRYGPDPDPVAAGRDLGVELVLQGAIQRSVDRLRANVSLVRVADGLTIWTDRFDSPWTDVFRMQDAIAEQVGRALAAALSGEGRQQVARRRTADVAAYEAYLKGRYFWNMRTIDALKRALVYFQQSIDRDPDYAPAYAGLADTYAMLGSMPYAVMPASEAAAKANAAAKSALGIDDTLAEAHASLAFVTYAFDWRWSDGEREFRRAIELDPTYATAHMWYSGYLGRVGRVDEAVAEAERSHELDPLSLIGTYSIGLAHYLGRRYDAAEEYARKTLEIDSNFPSARRLLGHVYAAQGRHADALVEFQRLNDTFRGNWLHKAVLAQAYGRMNDHRQTRKILEEMIDASKTGFVPPAQIAVAYIGLGDRDAAIAWLERAYAERSEALTFLKMDPMFDALRSDVRYVDLIRRTGLDVN